MNTEAADNLGMGFLIIYDSFNSSQIILDYYAKAIIEDIFLKNMTLYLKILFIKDLIHLKK